jgi:ProP effector
LLLNSTFMSTTPAAPAVQSEIDPAACALQLKERFPALFGGTPKPLKLRIQADIQERVPGVFTKQVLSAFLRRYTGTHSYLQALVQATHRYDLDGAEAAELLDEHRQAAVDELARRRTLQQSRREQEQQERRNRATLLREFQANTLPRDEFCAAKGVAEDALDGLLATAQREADERAAAPKRPERDRGPRGSGRPARGDGRGEVRGAPRVAAPAAADGTAPAAPGDASEADAAQRAARPPRPAREGDAARGPRGPRREGAPSHNGAGNAGGNASGNRGPRRDGGAPGGRPGRDGGRDGGSDRPMADRPPRGPRPEFNDAQRQPHASAAPARALALPQSAMQAALQQVLQAGRLPSAAAEADASAKPSGKPGK